MHLAKSKLLLEMQNKQAHLIDTDLAIVIKDAYPKAKYHFLVVPKEDISNVSAMTRDHLPLLDHMKELANQIIEQQQHLPSSNFLIGFKIDAFMNRLCMHVISDDFFSESMRRKKHWNSFNTALFITYQAVYAMLSIQGSIEPMPANEADKLRNSTMLRCNQCDFESDSLVALKGHLSAHWEEREIKFKITNQVNELTRMMDKTKLELKKIDEPIEDHPQAIVKTMQQPQWRQKMDQQPDGNSQKQVAPYPNGFQKNYKQGGAGQYVPQPLSEFRHFNQHALNQLQARASYNPYMNVQNPGSSSQFQRPPLNNQNHHNYRMGFANNNFKELARIEHQQNQPRFNPFRQSPNMGHGGPSRFPAPRLQHTYSANSQNTRPQSFISNRPTFNPIPPHYQTRNMNNNKKPETASIISKNTMQVKPNIKKSLDEQQSPDTVRQIPETASKVPKKAMQFKSSLKPNIKNSLDAQQSPDTVSQASTYPCTTRIITKNLRKK